MSSHTTGIPPKFLAKLDQSQRVFILTAVGRRFYEDFLCGHGKHMFIFGTTGGGKTQKGYAFVDWLKYLETQIWFDTGKTNEILPLLCMGRKVRIITPTGTDVVIEEFTGGNWKRIKNHPEVTPVFSPSQALSSISPGSWDSSRHRVRDTISIISFRNGFTKKELAVQWVAEFFETLAVWCRESKMPDIFPATIHVDESQWAMAGKRISGDGERSKASEVITENALELRSAGIRLALYAQAHNNIPPPARENMLFNVLCRGADVKSEEDSRLSKWCREASWRNPPGPTGYRPNQGRFVFENGDSYPPKTPWSFRLYPLSELDRAWISRLRVRYTGKHDQLTDEDEIQEESMPDTGRFSALMVPPDDPEPVMSRWSAYCEKSCEDEA